MSAESEAPLGQVRRGKHAGYERQHQFWEDLIRLASENDVDPWQDLKPRNSNDLRSQELPGVLVSWTIRVRANDAFPNLWIDLGDPTANAAVLEDLQRRAHVSGLGFSVTWDPKKRHRGCSVDAEPVGACGYAPEPSVRLPRLLELLDRDRLLRGAIRPHVLPAAAPFL